MRVACRNVSLTYASRDGDVLALAGLSLDVVSGELVCIVGPSGCGKTSLLRLIAGLVPPGGGDVLVGGAPAARASPLGRPRSLEDLGRPALVEPKGESAKIALAGWRPDRKRARIGSGSKGDQ